MLTGMPAVLPGVKTLMSTESRSERMRSPDWPQSLRPFFQSSAWASAVVAGSELYETKVRIRPLEKEAWEELVAQCEGQVGSMLDLLAGKLGEGVLKVLTDPEAGLFPRAREIRFDCSCPDHADLCKHAAAVIHELLAENETDEFDFDGVDELDVDDADVLPDDASPLFVYKLVLHVPLLKHHRGFYNQW